MPTPPSFQEALISQIPALRTLQQLGFTYLSPEECAVERHGRLGRVILEKVLIGLRRRQNQIRFKGREVAFSGKRIAQVLDTADQQLTLLRTQRTALDQQKRGLMQRLLTGKLRVKQ
jgi:hypothetical protein